MNSSEIIKQTQAVAKERYKAKKKIKKAIPDNREAKLLAYVIAKNYKRLI